jgi:molecular chaperone HscB
MNYFELFDLTIGFQVDTTKLRNAFMDIQKASHPDKFTQASEEKQNEALEKSAIANKAFTLLNNRDKILPYVLEVTGYLEAEEKYVLQPDFLMEMMELNEAWMEADSEAEKNKVKQQVQSIQNEILTPVKALLEAPSIDIISKEGMLQIKEYYYKKKYLDRILADFR